GHTWSLYLVFLCSSYIICETSVSYSIAGRSISAKELVTESLSGLYHWSLRGRFFVENVSEAKGGLCRML
ncbi:19320_t:CDS:2, partial [Gigaspora rosea]